MCHSPIRSHIFSPRMRMRILIKRMIMIRKKLFSRRMRMRMWEWFIFSHYPLIFSSRMRMRILLLTITLIFNHLFSRRMRMRIWECECWDGALRTREWWEWENERMKMKHAYCKNNIISNYILFFQYAYWKKNMEI